MRIAYFDVWDHYEDYSVNPKRYGSAACFARYAKEYLNNETDSFVLICNERNIVGLEDFENKRMCMGLSNKQCDALRQGIPIHKIVTQIEKSDVFLQHNPFARINLQGLESIPVAFWGTQSQVGEHVPPIRHTFFYNPNQVPEGYSYRVKIGPFVPDEFKQIRERGDFIYQCGSICTRNNQIYVAEWCRKNNVMGVFAGPIELNYPFLDLVDNHVINYVGEISMERSRKLFSAARLVTLCQTETMPFSLTAVEALAMGTPVCAPNKGAFSYLLQHGTNGFFWDGNNLSEAWEWSKFANPIQCWMSAKPYSHNEMIKSFRTALGQVVENHHKDIDKRLFIQ